MRNIEHSKFSSKQYVGKGGGGEGFVGFGRISPTLGLTMPPAWMDVVGVHVSSRSAAQFAIHAAQYLPRNLEPGTSSNLPASTPAPVPAPTPLPLLRIWRKWPLLQLVTRFWTMFSSYLEDNNGSHSFQIHESLKDKKVVLLAMPGAFTPICR